ncbi:MAG: GntR family transcriptional regulator, partial [Streptosporangiaceae bacterium]
MAIVWTRADQAFQRLRADILHGRFAPGSRLRIESLSQAYGLSSGVIREALPRLVGEGLAVASPQQGVRVVSVDMEDLAQLTDAAVEVETLVLRRSLAEGSIQWESNVVASHHQLSRQTLRDEDGTI